MAQNKKRPKIIIIAGAHSNVGKTLLANKIQSLLKGAVVIKIGHGERKENIDNYFYNHGINFEDILRNHLESSYLIIESNSILRQVDPDFLIYLPGVRTPKLSAERALHRADLIRGMHITDGKVSKICQRIGCSKNIALKIAEHSGVIIG